MNKLLKTLIPFFLLLCLGYGTMHATHNRAGEITYQQLDDLSIRATVTTYTKTSSEAADRDSVLVTWGDGTSEFVQRTNGRGDQLPNDIKVNFYIAEHTYPGRGTYTISMMDPNRVSNILNVNFPNSVNVPFYVETTFTFLNPQFQGLNSSAVLLQAPIDFACAGQVFIHNPNAYDQDGDSLSYSLVQPFQNVDMPVPNYVLPDKIDPSPENNITIDAETGSVVWRAPQIQGEYNIAIRINEYREGVLINSITRDLQIFVNACMNTPPVVSSVEELCVLAGEKIEFPVEVTDADEGQMLLLSASGGPFEIENPAELIIPDEASPSPLQGTFVWQTNCNHISDQYYQVVFRGVDDFLGDTGLADLKTVRIKVVGAPPEDLFAESDKQKIKLSWSSPYSCEETEDDFFKGFSVWRKVGNENIPLDQCTPGLDNSGYKKIIFLTNEIEDGRYVAFDDGVEKGITYCYRVLAEFARNTDDGNPFNKVQSLRSDEVCRQLSRDLPLITQVSVINTDDSDGHIQIRWTKPLAEELDTIENPGPYRYQLQRRITDMPDDYVDVQGADFTTTYFDSPVDTSYLDTGLQTWEVQYSYRVVFYASNIQNAFGSSTDASSVFLDIQPLDRKNSLTWRANVPWDNASYIIYRQDSNTGLFDSIGISTRTEYIDLGLENGQPYCYKITSIGTYGIPGLAEPILNDSQEACGTPEDTEGPCSPELMVSNFCDEAEELTFDEENVINNLEWTRPFVTCTDSQDLVGYELYFRPVLADEYTLIQTVEDRDTDRYDHKPDEVIAGCYYIVAYDENGNRSDPSTEVCVQDCPFYELPNVFTPNADNANDLLTPIQSRFIDEIDLKIFNRWGAIVFETSDPEISWDGKNLRNQDLAEGVYYYTCRVFNNRGGGISQEPLRGYIHLYR